MPLPPLGVDTYRKWAADRWKGVTDATIGRVQSGLWDMQAEDAISRLRPLELPEPEPIYQPPEPAYEPPPPPPPLPLPQPEPQSSTSPLDALRTGVGATLSGLGGRASSALSGAQAGVGGWASRAEDAISGLGDQWGADLERIRGEREAIEQQFPTPEPTGPAGFTLPQTGTPEGERITSELAETAMRETPGGQVVLSTARAMAPQGPMTAETPGTNLLGIGQAAPTPWNVTRAWRGACAGRPRRRDLSPRGAAHSRLGAWRGGAALTAETPVLGGLTTPDEALPFAVGIAGGTPREAMDALSLAARPASALADIPYRFGQAARAELGTAERVVPPSVVAGLPYDVRLPTDPADLRILTQSNSVRLTPQGVEVDLRRAQKPSRPASPSAGRGCSTARRAPAAPTTSPPTPTPPRGAPS